MKSRSKMMVVMGALALTATALLAGCRSSSAGSTAASEPAASAAAVSEAPGVSEAPMLEVPVSISDGLLKPAGFAQDDWETLLKEGVYPLATMIDTATPKELAETCATGEQEIADQAVSMVETYLALGGTSEEWTIVWGTVLENFRLMACSAAE